MLHTPGSGYKDRLPALVALPFYFGIALLLVNQRIGWGDSGGPQLLAVVSRPDLWLAFGLIAAWAKSPKWVAHPAKIKGAYQQTLVKAPLAFIAFGLLASAVSAVRYGEAFDSFGAVDMFKTALCAVLGVTVFNLSLSHEKFAPTVISILTWAPIANIVVAIFVTLTNINNIPGFNAVAEEGTAGSGFVGLGNRFQGLASNPNIVFIQTSIGFALLLPKLMEPLHSNPLKKAALLLYAVSLCGIMAWTGVRASLVVLPTIFSVFFWLRFRFTASSAKKSFILAAKIFALLLLIWVGSMVTNLQETMLSRLEGGEDVRLLLWAYYSNQLIENPLGFGFAFDSIAETDDIIPGQRLPPHNAVLQAGMYSGIAGVLISVFVLFRIASIVMRVKSQTPPSKLSSEFMGVTLAWVAVVTSLMFAGLFAADFSFSILTALLLNLSSRQLSTPLQARLPSSHG